MSTDPNAACPALTLAAVSHQGRRVQQEDSWCTKQLAAGALCVVADGMGGHAQGEVASNLAVGALEQENWEGELAARPREALQRVAARANTSILTYAAEHEESVGLGTTIVTCLVYGRQATIAHAGDSRAWLVVPGKVVQLTKDHSAVQDAINRGTISPEQASGSPFREAILRCLGDEKFPGLEFTPASADLDVPDGSVLILTSDGAHGVLTANDFLTHIAGTPTLADALDNLLRLAYHRGSTDNITLVGCEVGTFPRSAQTVPQPPPIGAPPARPVSKSHDLKQRARRYRRRILIVFAWLLALLAALLVLLFLSIREFRLGKKSTTAAHVTKGARCGPGDVGEQVVKLASSLRSVGGVAAASTDFT